MIAVAILAAAPDAGASLAGLLRAGGYRRIAARALPSGVLTVEGRLNGRAVRLLIDTGAEATAVDRGWAQSAGLSLRPFAGEAAGAGAGGVRLAQVEGVLLEVGGVALAGERVLALDLSAVRAVLARYGGEPPQLVLGSDTLRRAGAIIDMARGALWLRVPAAAQRTKMLLR